MLGLLLSVLSSAHVAHGHGLVEHRTELPVVTTARVGDFHVSLHVEGGALIQGKANRVTARIVHARTKTPVSGLTVFLVVPHQHPTTQVELMDYMQTYGDPADQTMNVSLLDRNIGETGETRTVEGPNGHYSLSFTPVYEAIYEVHVLIGGVDPSNPSQVLEVILSLPVIDPVQAAGPDDASGG